MREDDGDAGQNGRTVDLQRFCHHKQRQNDPDGDLEGAKRPAVIGCHRAGHEIQRQRQTPDQHREPGNVHGAVMPRQETAACRINHRLFDEKQFRIDRENKGNGEHHDAGLHS